MPGLFGGGGDDNSTPAPIVPITPTPTARPAMTFPTEPVNVVPGGFTGGFTQEQMNQLPGVRLQLSMMPRNALMGQFFPQSMQGPQSAYHPPAPAAPQQDSSPMSLAPNFSVQRTMNDGSQVLTATAPKGGMFANGQWYPEGSSIFGFYKNSPDGPVQYIQPNLTDTGMTGGSGAGG